MVEQPLGKLQPSPLAQPEWTQETHRNCRAFKYLALAVVQGSGNHDYCHFICFSSPSQLVELLQKKPRMQLLPHAATWCNLNHTQKSSCEASEVDDAGSLAWTLSERIPR